MDTGFVGVVHAVDRPTKGFWGWFSNLCHRQIAFRPLPLLRNLVI